MSEKGQEMRRSVTNTQTDQEHQTVLTEGLLFALEGRDASMAIERQEERGQAELVASDVLPNPDQPYERIDRMGIEAMGIVLGEPVEGDPLFVAAELPSGWTRQATDHPMWAKIVDERGEERVAVFYKAAFYDRHAFMRVVPLCGVCLDSQSSHPHAGYAVDGSAENGWKSIENPKPCQRSGCGCSDFTAAER